MVSEDPDNPHMFERLTMAVRKASENNAFNSSQNDKHTKQLQNDLKAAREELAQLKRHLNDLEKNDQRPTLQVISR